MIDKVFKNKSGGYIRIISDTALDYRAQYLDDDSVEFSITKDVLKRYWNDMGFSIHSEPVNLPARNLSGNLSES